MRVIQIGPNSVHVRNFIHALNERSAIESFLITDSQNTEKGIPSLTEDLHTLNPIKLVKKRKRIQETIEEFRPDVIHIHQVNRMAFWLSRVAVKLKIPIVITAWGSDVLLMPKRNALFYFLVKSTLKRAKVVTADAHQMIEAMRAIVSDKKYVWLQYGIEPIEPKVKEKIIYSNRLHQPLYRIDQVVELFAEFRENNQEWHLKIAATGTETNALKNKVENLNLSNAVSFEGWLSNEENRLNYETAAIYISIPESDGTSVSLLEAMSAGCIPVVSDLPSNREWIQDRENGIVWNGEENPFQLAILLNSEAVAQQNWQMITEKATRKASIDQFIKIYNELIK